MSDILTTKPYQLVEFIRSGRKSVTRSVDITLFKWIRYDKIKKKFVSKYMPEPYTEERTAVLYDLIKKKASAPKEWPEYTINFVGHADTYKLAVERLNVLKFQKHSYTTDTEVEAFEKVTQIEEQLKKMDPYNAGLEGILDVPKLSERNIVRTYSLTLQLDPLAIEDAEEDAEAEITDNSISDKNMDVFAKSREKSSRHKEKFDIIEGEISRNSSSDENANISEKNRKIISCRKRKLDKTLHFDTDSGTENYISDENFRVPHKKLSKAYDKPGKSNNINIKKTRQELVMGPKHLSEISHSKRDSMVYNILKDVQAGINDLKADVKEMKTILEIGRSAHYLNQKPFQEEYNLQLPFKTLEYFVLFDAQLATDKECCSRFLSFYLKANLDFTMSKDSGLRRALNNTLKKYFNRDLIINFTAVREVANKHLFKKYNFCTHLLAVICVKFETTEEEALSHIGTIIGNSKDWGGRRKERTKTTH